MFKRYFLLLFTTGICIFILATAFAADDLQAKEALTIKQAIEIALKNNPNIRVSSEASIAGHTRIGQTQSAYYPQVNLQSRYSHSCNETGPSAGRDSYGSSVNLNQLIFDFGKTTALLGSAKENYKSLKESYKNTRQIIALNTKVAYYTCLAAQRELKLTGETIRQREQLLYQAKQYFKTGVKPKIDVTRAEANYYDAKLSFIRAQNMLKVAKINLMKALAVEKLPGDGLQDVLELKKSILMDVAGAKSMAMEQRTELAQNRALERGREFSLKATKAEHMPMLSGNASYGWSGADFPLQEEWTVGMKISFPLFTGFKKREKIKEEKAKLRQTKASRDVIVQNVLAEVEEAYADMDTAAEGIIAAKSGKEASRENLKLAAKRYEQGLNDIIEVSDAQVQSLRAETVYIKSLYEYKKAEAMLEKVIGKSY